MHAGRPRPYVSDRVARLLLKSTPGSGREPRAARDRPPVRLRIASRLAARDAGNAAGAAVIKSVHCPLAVEWIAARWQPVVLVVLRHPLNVLASSQELAMHDQDRRLDREPSIQERVTTPMGVRPLAEGASALARASWQLGLLMSSLIVAAGRHGWPISWHEDLCDDPPAAFAGLARSSGLEWLASGDDYLRSSDRPGRGFSLNRVAAQARERWRDTLDGDQVEEVGRVLAGFPPLTPWFGSWGLRPQSAPEGRDRERRSTA
jgi:hypothetical protein